MCFCRIGASDLAIVAKRCERHDEDSDEDYLANRARRHPTGLSLWL